MDVDGVHKPTNITEHHPGRMLFAAWFLCVKLVGHSPPWGAEDTMTKVFWKTFMWRNLAELMSW